MIYIRYRRWSFKSKLIINWYKKKFVGLLSIRITSRAEAVFSFLLGKVIERINIYDEWDNGCGQLLFIHSLCTFFESIFWGGGDGWGTLRFITHYCMLYFQVEFRSFFFTIRRNSSGPFSKRKKNSVQKRSSHNIWKFAVKIYNTFYWKR